MYALSDHDCESLKGGDRPPKSSLKNLATSARMDQLPTR